MRIFVIGIDGATWSVMKPMINKGQLPNIQSLMREGSAGGLETIDAEKYLSPALWTSIDTGKHPEKHQVKDFYGTTRHHVKAKRLYQMLDGIDGRIGLFRWYCTWPPEKNNGFTVPDWVARTPETYPSELEFITALSRHSLSRGYLNTALMCIKNGVSLPTLVQAAYSTIHKKLTNPPRRDWYGRERILETRLYGEVFLHLSGKYGINYGAILFGAVDALQHQYWKYYDPEGFDELKSSEIQAFRDVIPSVYREVDRFIGKLCKMITDRDLLVVVSDHGMQSMKMERGKTRPFKIKTTALLQRMKIDSDITSFSANFNICLMLKNSRIKNGDIIQRTIDRLKKVRLQRSDEEIFEVISTEQDRFFIRFNDRIEYNAGDIISMGDNGTCHMSDLIIDRPEVSACHHSQGIFIIRHRHVKKNCWIDGAGLLDILPTVLRLLNMPVARDLDGRVLEEVIEDTYLSGHPLRTVDTYEDREKVKEDEESDLTKEERTELQSKLHDLGYFD